MAEKVLDALTLRDTKSGTTTEYKIQDTTLKARVDNLTKLGEGSTTGDAELQDIRVDYKGVTHENAGDAVRASDQALEDLITDEVNKLNQDLTDQYLNILQGNLVLDMNWIEGYWYDANTGIMGVADSRFVCSGRDLIGDGTLLNCTKQGITGMSMYITKYTMNDKFVSTLQMGNSVYEFILEKGYKYKFSISRTAGMSAEIANNHYVFTRVIDLIKLNSLLKSYTESLTKKIESIENFTKKIIYIGENREFTTLRDGIAEAVKSNGSIVYVDSGVYDIISEYGTEYFKNYKYNVNDCGIVLKNDVHIIFSSNAKVICNYEGDNTDVMYYFSPFNVGEGGFSIENLTIEASRVRYCIHDDLGMFGNSKKFTRTEYNNCSMYLDNTKNTVRENYNCIGGGLPYNGEVIIHNCIFESTASGEKYGGVDYHQNGSTGAKSKSVITGCYFTGVRDRYSCSALGQTQEISTVIVSNCSSGVTCGYAHQETYTNSIKFLSWNNIRRQ